MKINEYISGLKYIQQQFSQLQKVTTTASAILATVNAYQMHQLPDAPLPSLELDDNYIYNHLLNYPKLIDVTPFFENLRQVLIENLGIWHVCNQQWIDDLQRFCGAQATNLEIMAGNAMITKFLAHTYATDNFAWKGQDNEHPQPWTNVEKLDALAAVIKYAPIVDNIIMAWAPDSTDIDWQVLRQLRQLHYRGNVIVIGEYQGNTNSKQFWQHARLTCPSILNRHHRPFDFIRDKVWIAK